MKIWRKWRSFMEQHYNHQFNTKQQEKKKKIRMQLGKDKGKHLQFVSWLQPDYILLLRSLFLSLFTTSSQFHYHLFCRLFALQYPFHFLNIILLFFILHSFALQNAFLIYADRNFLPVQLDFIWPCAPIRYVYMCLQCNCTSVTKCISA